MLEIKDVFKSFGEKKVLGGVSLKVDGEAVALMGESGGGKTTILRIIADLEKADGGEIIKTGKTAVAFAEPRLFDNVRVIDNVTCVMPKENGRQQNEKRARELLDSLLLGGAEHLYPRELSSGMAARVSLCRALAYGAENIVLDEPLRTLDEETKGAVIDVLKREFDGKSVIMITHDGADAMALCKRTVVLADGKIREKTEDPE